MTERVDKLDMPVVILAGGLGTRLKEETEKVPKPLVPIGERPILWHIMKVYGHHGFGRFVLCLGYKSWLIKQWFLQYREELSDVTIPLSGNHEPEFHNAPADENWRVTCMETGLMTGTGGRLSLAREYVDTPTFMFTYGDGLGNVDLDALLDFHYEHGRLVTVTGVHPTSRYGEILLDGSYVTEFNEKPTKATGRVSGGFMVMQREFFDYLPAEDRALTLEHGPLQQVARDGQMAMYEHDGYWIGMDTYRELSELNGLWASGEAPWKVWKDE